MLRLSPWFAVAAVLFIPLSAGAQGFCPPVVTPAPVVVLYTPAPAVSFYTPAVSYPVAVTSYSVPGYGYAPSYYYTPSYSYGYGGYGYRGYSYGGYGYRGYNPGGLGGPWSGLGVRPGLGLGGFGLRR
jgi:hypothetical protein